MRILTVRQPWASAIVYMGKDVENRVRNIAGQYRGPVAIHVSKRLPPFQEHWDAGTVVASITGRRPLFHDPASMGAIIGVVDLVDAHLCAGGCSPWAQDSADLGNGLRDIWHLALANPRPLAEPIPYKGALGLRELDAETTERVLASIVNPEEAL